MFWYSYIIYVRIVYTMANMLKARAWARNTLIVGNRQVAFTMEEMHRHRRGRERGGASDRDDYVYLVGMTFQMCLF